jgi:hypothetical protein
VILLRIGKDELERIERETAGELSTEPPPTPYINAPAGVDASALREWVSARSKTLGNPFNEVESAVERRVSVAIARAFEVGFGAGKVAAEAEERKRRSEEQRRRLEAPRD